MLGFTQELLLAVNGQGRFVRDCLKRWPAAAPEIRLIELKHRVSSAICLQEVVPECRSELLVICGPYQQFEYADLGLVLNETASGTVDLALPRRENRIDPLVNRSQSWLFNWLVRKMTDTAFHDLSCLVRVARKPVMSEVPMYGDLYRYLPLLAARRGFKVKEYPVIHRQERGKIGFFGTREYVSRIVDMVGMHFTFTCGRKPLRYFGILGMALFLIGTFAMSFALWQRLFSGVDLGDSGLLMAGLLLMVSGSGVWGIGLLGEILAFVFGRTRKDYIIEQILE
jgi:hypothetical protein